MVQPEISRSEIKVRNALREFKRLMMSNESHLSKYESLLRWLIEVLIISAVFFFLFVQRDSTFIFFGISSGTRLCIAYVLVLSAITVLHYLREKHVSG